MFSFSINEVVNKSNLNVSDIYDIYKKATKEAEFIFLCQTNAWRKAKLSIINFDTYDPFIFIQKEIETFSRCMYLYNSSAKASEIIFNSEKLTKQLDKAIKDILVL